MVRPYKDFEYLTKTQHNNLTERCELFEREFMELALRISIIRKAKYLGNALDYTNYYRMSQFITQAEDFCGCSTDENKLLWKRLLYSTVEILISDTNDQHDDNCKDILTDTQKHPNSSGFTEKIIERIDEGEYSPNQFTLQMLINHSLKINESRNEKPFPWTGNDVAWCFQQKHSTLYRLIKELRLSRYWNTRIQKVTNNGSREDSVHYGLGIFRLIFLYKEYRYLHTWKFYKDAKIKPCAADDAYQLDDFTAEGNEDDLLKLQALIAKFNEELSKRSLPTVTCLDNLFKTAAN